MNRLCLVFSMAACLFILQQSNAHSQTQSMVSVNGSVADHYMNLFHGGLKQPSYSQIPPQHSFGGMQLQPAQNFAAPVSAWPRSSGYQDFNNPFGQHDPQLAGTINMPRVDHSQLLALTRLPRNELHRLVQTGQSPTLQEMDGLWYGFNTGNFPETFGFSQFIKDLRTNSHRPMGTNILVHQLPPSQLNNGKGWTPKVDISRNRLAREGSFAVLPPDGVGAFGHTAKGVYAMGGNSRNYPGNRIRTRIVKLDAQFMLGQSTLRVGGSYVHSGFFVLQRLPSGALVRE